MPNPNELVDGLETTTFAGIVLALYVTRVAAGEYGPVDIVALQNFSGLSRYKLIKMRDAEVELKQVNHSSHGSARIFYEPTKVALAKALAESLAIAAQARQDYADALRYGI